MSRVDAITTNLGSAHSQHHVSGFASPFPGGAKRRNVLVENGNAAERSTRPLRIILLEFRIDRLQEGADEGHLPRGAHDRAFLGDVTDYRAKGQRCRRRQSRNGLHTLIISDKETENGEEDLPRSRLHNGLDDIFDGLRYVHGAEADGGQRRRERRGINGVHCDVAREATV